MYNYLEEKDSLGGATARLTGLLLYFLILNSEKIEALEEKIKTEMVTLKEKMGKMNEDMKIFSDIDRFNLFTKVSG